MFDTPCVSTPQRSVMVSTSAASVESSVVTPSCYAGCAPRAACARNISRCATPWRTPRSGARGWSWDLRVVVVSELSTAAIPLNAEEDAALPPAHGEAEAVHRQEASRAFRHPLELDHRRAKGRGFGG